MIAAGVDALVDEPDVPRDGALGHPGHGQGSLIDAALAVASDSQHSHASPVAGASALASVAVPQQHPCDATSTSRCDALADVRPTTLDAHAEGSEPNAAMAINRMATKRGIC
ncbi:MAG: hypothetical protein K2X32_03015 [Phycisphaerales bacterium]|nr:hypothetical protein [Phycisphaerales bacterium]